jgi:hypothetical protein
MCPNKRKKKPPNKKYVTEPAKITTLQEESEARTNSKQNSPTPLTKEKKMKSHRSQQTAKQTKPSTDNPNNHTQLFCNLPKTAEKKN